MEISIPRNLAGDTGGGVGDAMMGVGATLNRAGREFGGMMDQVRANYDYNASSELENNELRPKIHEQYLEFMAKDDGSDPEAFSKYQQERQKIVDDVLAKAGKVNERVAQYVKKTALNWSAQYDEHAQTAIYEKLYKKSITTDEDNAQLAISNALNMGGDTFQNVNTAINDSKVKIMARSNFYGEGNAKTVFDGAMSKAIHDNIEIALKDPAQSRAVISMMKDPAQKEAILAYLTPAGKSRVLGLLDVMNKEVTLGNGMEIGTAIFKADQTGKLESMTDAVRALDLDVETERAAITQIKELKAERNADDKQRADDAKDKANKKLNAIALKRNGINRVSDLSPSDWAELERDNPEYAKQLQDNMRRELDYETRQNKAEAREAKKERMLIQAENEQEIMLDEDFRKRDLRSDLATGKISTTQYNRLTKIQGSMDPMKRSSVKNALQRINTGGALAAALGGLEKNEEAQWKLKYGELIKAFAEKNIDDPNFDTKLMDFMEKQVLSEMGTWFFTTDQDRIDKFNAAKDEAGIVQVGKRKSYSQADIEFTAKKYGITVQEVKKRLGVQ